jgi:transposase
MGYDFIVLFPINPVTLTRYREAFTPSRAKDDPVDADLLCELVARHREQLKAWQPDDVCTRKLRHLTQARRRSVNMRTRLSNQLKALLKSYFPEALELGGEDLTTPMACALLQNGLPSSSSRKFARKPFGAFTTRTMPVAVM